MRTALPLVLVAAAGVIHARAEKPDPEPKLDGSWAVVKAAEGGVPLVGGGTHLTLVTFDQDGGYRLVFRKVSVTAMGVTDAGGYEEVGKFRVSGRELDLLDKGGRPCRGRGSSSSTRANSSWPSAPTGRSRSTRPGSTPRGATCGC